MPNRFVSRLLGLLGLGALVLALSACFDPASTVSDRDVQVIKAEDLAAMLAKSPDKVVLVDVRSPAAYDQEHIRGAINIPLSDLREADPRFAAADTIVVYGDDYTDPQSMAAAKKLLRMGYPNVLDLRLGLTDWKNERGADAVEPAEALGPPSDQ